MEPDVTPQDLAMLLLSQRDLVALGAMLGLRARMASRAFAESAGADEDQIEIGSA